MREGSGMWIALIAFPFLIYLHISYIFLNGHIFYHCPFKTGKGGFTMKNRKFVLNENEVQLKRMRNITSLSWKPETALRTLWLLAWFLIGSELVRGRGQVEYMEGKFRTQNYKGTNIAMETHAAGVWDALGPDGQGAWCLVRNPLGRQSNDVTWDLLQGHFPFLPEELWSPRLVHIDSCLCLGNCLQWNHEFVQFFSVSVIHPTSLLQNDEESLLCISIVCAVKIRKQEPSTGQIQAYLKEK